MIVVCKRIVERFGIETLALVDFAVDGECTVAGVGGEHLCRTSRRGKQHRFPLHFQQRLHQCAHQRRFSRARIAVQQEHRTRVGVHHKLAERRNKLHLLRIGVVGELP